MSVQSFTQWQAERVASIMADHGCTRAEALTCNLTRGEWLRGLCARIDRGEPVVIPPAVAYRMSQAEYLQVCYAVGGGPSPWPNGFVCPAARAAIQAAKGGAA